MSRSTVRTSQHKRLIGAMVVLAAERGYPNVTIAGLVAEAGVAKPTFYDHFTDKEACFITAYEQIAEAAGTAVNQALSPDAPVETRVSAGVKGHSVLCRRRCPCPRVVDRIAEGRSDRRRHRHRGAHSHGGLYVQWREESRVNQPELASITVTRGLSIVGAIIEPVTVMLRDNPASKIMELADELNTVAEVLAFAYIAQWRATRQERTTPGSPRCRRAAGSASTRSSTRRRS